jgi:hypothetical protein
MDYFERKLDDKRRLTIPTELRAEFASGVVVTRGFGEYLHLYPQQVWNREVEPALAGDHIFDEALADLNVRSVAGRLPRRWTKNRAGSRSSSICSTTRVSLTKSSRSAWGNIGASEHPTNYFSLPTDI